MPLEMEATEFPAVWAAFINEGRLDEVLALYCDDAVLMPTFSSDSAKDKLALEVYFTGLAVREGLNVTLDQSSYDSVHIGGRAYVVSGFYDFAFAVGGVQTSHPSRFTFVIDLDRGSPILHHHSSLLPSVGVGNHSGMTGVTG